MVHHQIRELSAVDGHGIRLQAWQPAGSPGCVIQVLHGLGEYSDRYARFAAAACEKGFAVVAHDHRGHGPEAASPGHFADRNGWRLVNGDVETVHDALRTEFTDVPVVMLGHSMGSFVAQRFAMHYGAKLAGLILSASTWPSRFELAPAKLIAHVEKLRLGAQGKSPLLHKLGFGGYNRRFRPPRTAHDWLSRDTGEVDKYAADPLCGGPFSCSLWLDLVGGLFEISSDHALSRIPSDLPILITGGSLDPLGGESGMGTLALHYAQTLHQDLTIRIFEDGRHESLNEINRDEVTADWLEWVADAATRRSSRSG